jgi:hypothetical protein
MYQKPAWRRHMVCFSSQQNLVLGLSLLFKHFFTSDICTVFVQACTDDSPHEGPFKKDAPAWCTSPFEPEGILR